MSNTHNIPGGVEGETYYYGRQWTPAHPFLQGPPRPAQVNTNHGHVVGRNISHESVNTEGDTYTMNSSSAGISDSTFPTNPRAGRFETLRSTNPTLPYPTTYGTSDPRIIRGPPLNIATDHTYYSNQAPGFPQPHAPLPSGTSNTSSLNYHDSGQPGHDNSLQIWSPGSSPISPVSQRSTSPHKTASARTRKGSQRPLHCQYTDPLLRSKYPEGRHYALNLAIQFRDNHGPTTPIPNDLIDELLQWSDDGKYYCFCCPMARKSRTITPARDHVRKSLGNFPFRCPNSWCQHSSLRQADLTKHTRTCTE